MDTNMIPNLPVSILRIPLQKSGSGSIRSLRKGLLPGSRLLHQERGESFFLWLWVP